MCGPHVSVDINSSFSRQSRAIAYKRFTTAAVARYSTVLVRQLVAAWPGICAFPFKHTSTAVYLKHQVLSWDLDKRLRPMMQYLIDCRPHSVSMGNAYKVSCDAWY